MSLNGNIIKGIIVSYKEHGENSALIGLLSDESFYIRGWLDLSKTYVGDRQAISIGMQIVVHKYERNDNVRFVLDSVEHSMMSLFMTHPAKLHYLLSIISKINLLPEHTIISNLYSKFLKIIARLEVGDDYQEILEEWEAFLLDEIN